MKKRDISSPHSFLLKPFNDLLLEETAGLEIEIWSHGILREIVDKRHRGNAKNVRHNSDRVISLTMQLSTNDRVSPGTKKEAVHAVHTQSKC